MTSISAEAIADKIRDRTTPQSPYALISEFRCGYQMARRAMEIARPSVVAVTESELLDLSGTISNRVTEITGQPITESEDCHLAMAIGQWLQETGISVTSDPTHRD